MNLTTAVKKCLDNLTNFEGRASRSEYWWYSLTVFSALVAIMILAFSFLGFEHIEDGLSGGTLMIFGLPSLIAAFCMISVSVRRLHDLDRSGWWLLGFWLAGMLPVVGLIANIAYLVYLCLRGTVGENQYGSDPLSD